MVKQAGIKPSDVVNPPKDVMFLELACPYNPDYLLSGDKHLLALKGKMEPSILTLREFYDSK